MKVTITLTDGSKEIVYTNSPWNLIDSMGEDVESFEIEDKEAPAWKQAG